MKTILVPTDFSDNAKVALDYAIELSKEIGARILLMNCYQMPSGSANVMIDFHDILEKDAIKELDDVLKSIDTKDRKDVEIIPVAHYGYLEDGAEALGKSYRIDLIVMGTSGAGSLKNKFFGSNTTNLLKKISVPMLVIPKGATWKGWNNIHVAFDPDTKKNGAIFRNVLDLIAPMKTHFDVIHVIKDEESEALRNDLKNRVTNAIGSDDFDMNFEQATTTTDGILKHISYNPCDLLVMVRKNHSFLEKLMHASVTKQMAIHTNKPLLLYKDDI